MRRKDFYIFLQCHCLDCRGRVPAAANEVHTAINRVMSIANERQRRLIAGLLARVIDSGDYPKFPTKHYHNGTGAVADITGISRDTIRRGWKELTGADFSANGRSRRPGAGRKIADRSKDGG